MTITFGHTGSHRAKEDNLRDNFIKKVHKLFPPQNIIRNGNSLCGSPNPKKTPEKKNFQHSLAENSHGHMMTWKIIKYHQKQ